MTTSAQMALTKIKMSTDIVRADELRPGDMIVGYMDHRDQLIRMGHLTSNLRIVIAISIINLSVRMIVLTTGSAASTLSVECSDVGMCFFRRLM